MVCLTCNGEKYVSVENWWLHWYYANSAIVAIFHLKEHACIKEEGIYLSNTWVYMYIVWQLLTTLNFMLHYSSPLPQWQGFDKWFVKIMYVPLIACHASVKLFLWIKFADWKQDERWTIPGGAVLTHTEVPSLQVSCLSCIGSNSSQISVKVCVRVCVYVCWRGWYA